MPNPPPLAPSGNPPPLRKFTLHPPSLTAPTSPLTLAANGSGALSSAALQGLRQTLTQARTSAAERLSIRDANRRNLADRQANEKRMAEEQARQKEVERKRKREEDERREKERIEKAERERIEREREEGAKRQKEEEEYQMLKKQEEDDKQRKDDEERLAAIKRAREMKEKKRADEVMELVKANEEKQAKQKEEAERVQAAAAAAAEAKDVKMEDAPVEMALAPAATPAPPVQDLTPVAKAAVPSIAIASSPEPEDDFGQPKVPVRNHDKKKRKRDQIIDSDASDSDPEDSQPLLQKARKLDSKPSTTGPTPSPTPHPNGTPRTLSFTISGAPPPPPDDPYAGLSVIERKLKEDKFVKHSIPIRPPAPGNATAFYLPSHHLVPQKPASLPQVPTPKRQSDVRGDFSAAKPGTQIAHHTFHTWADAYLRPFGEDDLAFLAPKPEDITPYLIPPLGKHYTERWEEEDSNLPIAATSNYASPLEPPPLLRTRPEMLTEDASGAENVFLGPLSERLVAALAFQEEGEESDEDAQDAEGLKDGQRFNKQQGMDGALVDRRGQMDAVELEERIKRELRFIGILPDEDVDWTAREDDEVSSALRACQRELHHQTALNESRKVILTSIVKDRMAYQDYETTRDAQERIIENGWTKRQRSGKKKGKGKDRDKGADGTKLPISLTLLEALDKRNKLVGSFRPFFEEEEDQGRFQGIPESSVYEGLEEMLRAEEEEEELALP